MANQATITNAAVAGQPIQNGPHIVSTQVSLIPGAAVTGVYTPNSEKIQFYIAQLGTATSDSTVDLEVSLDGSNFYAIKRWAYADIVTNSIGGQNRLWALIEMKVLNFRLRLNAGTMTGSNGYNVRFMD